MTTIGPHVHIVGEVHSSEDLRIEGRIQGHIHVPDAVVVIAPQACIDADIRGKQITIHGSVRGTVSASDRIVIDASASVTGSLSANHVVLIEGARFKGQIDMNRRTIAAKVARHKAKTES